MDTLQLSGTGIVLDLTQIRNIGPMDPEISGRISGIEVINLVDKTNSVKLAVRDVLDMSDAVDLVSSADYRQLVVRGPIGATVDFADSPDGKKPWVRGTTINGAGWGDQATLHEAYVLPTYLTPSNVMVFVRFGLMVV